MQKQAVTAALGMTLIEMVITIVVLGVAMSALISALASGISRSATPLWEGKALELSQAYLDEILAMRFDEAQPVGGGSVSGCSISSDGQSRSHFNDVDDYHGLTDAPPQLVETAIDMSEYAAYQVTVNVTCAGTEVGFSSDLYAKRITVTVTVPGGSARTLSAYKGNF